MVERASLPIINTHITRYSLLKTRGIIGIPYPLIYPFGSIEVVKTFAAVAANTGIIV